MALRGFTIVTGGFVKRYETEKADDGLQPGEGAFLACSFWLADAYCSIDRREDGAALFERLLAIRNDLGLMAEEYDPVAGRFLGNFPQAFSHTAIINTGAHLAELETASVARGNSHNPDPNGRRRVTRPQSLKSDHPNRHPRA